MSTRKTTDEPLPEIRDGFKFRSGRLALDLPATLAARLKAKPRELLATPEDLGRWFVAAGIARNDPEAPLRATPKELDQARALREALYRLGMACVTGTAFEAKDRELLNRFAAEPPPVPQLGAEGDIQWSRPGVRAFLSMLARDGVELFGGPLAARIRQCAGEGCALLFVDISRSGERRWCSMAGCGNKAKVAELRRRRRTSPNAAEP